MKDELLDFAARKLHTLAMQYSQDAKLEDDNKRAVMLYEMAIKYEEIALEKTDNDATKTILRGSVENLKKRIDETRG